MLCEKLLEGCKVMPGVEYTDFIRENPEIAEKTVYTGTIDGFFGYQLGQLEYRTVRFEDEIIDCDNWQGCAVVNYTGDTEAFTRIIEHKHFVFGQQEKTVISREYPCEWQEGMEPYYPVNDEKNSALYAAYAELAAQRPDVIFGGRLGGYKYFDMDQTVRAALDAVNREKAALN